MFSPGISLCLVLGLFNSHIVFVSISSLTSNENDAMMLAQSTYTIFYFKNFCNLLSTFIKCSFIKFYPLNQSKKRKRKPINILTKCNGEKLQIHHHLSYIVSTSNENFQRFMKVLCNQFSCKQEVYTVTVIVCTRCQYYLRGSGLSDVVFDATTTTKTTTTTKNVAVLC